MVNQKYKVSNISKDLDIKSKDIINMLAKNGIEGKTHSAVLEKDEFAILMDALTKERQIDNIDDYLNGVVKVENKAEAERQAKEQAEREAAEKAAREEAERLAREKAEREAAEKAAREEAERLAREKAEREAAEKAAREEAERLAREKAEREAAEKAAREEAERLASEKAEREAAEKAAREEAERLAREKAEREAAEKAAREAAEKPKLQQSRNDRERRNDKIFANPPQQPKQQKPQKPQRPQNQRLQQNLTIGQNAEIDRTVKVQSADEIARPQQGRTRVVDTRTASGAVDLSKYDERLETLVPEAAKDLSPDKQKLKKQNNNNRGGDKERAAMDKLKKQEIEKARRQQLSITVPDEITVGELAAKLKITAGEIIKRLMKLGVMATINQVIDYDTAYLIADEIGAKVTREVVVTIEDKLFEAEEDAAEMLEPRAPVIVVMGHVDHGKTSLLDAIRHTNVTAGEAGGITQHIGAYRIKVGDKDITFLDTPGHEAFTAMRARGAQATDIAILVVAADDGIMPQTVEAINHAKAAGLDIIVAINKMDKPGANPDNIKQELTKYDLVPEEWGGDVICVPVSALKGDGIEDLLENVLLVAEVKELKANPNRRAKGIVIEAKLDRGRGPVATVLVQNGTLRNGDVVIAGTAVGRVRAMVDHNGKALATAGPSVPAEIIGLDELPAAGDEFNAVEDERMARELAEQRKNKQKEEIFKANAKVNLDDLFAQISDGVKDLNIIVKADVDGSAEAVKASLARLSNEEVKVNIIHTGVGGITESDVMLAAASNAIIVGFNVRPDKGAIDSAERQKVDIRTYRIIYECIEEITAAMKGMLAPTFKEQLLGHAEVRQTIHVPNVGTIAGSYVQDGKVTRNSQIRIVRDGIVIFEDKISSLKRFKDDAREVASGFECGIGLERFNDIKEGDILEAFEMVEVEK